MNGDTGTLVGFRDVVEVKDYVDWKRKTHLESRHGVIRIHFYTYIPCMSIYNSP